MSPQASRLEPQLSGTPQESNICQDSQLFNPFISSGRWVGENLLTRVLKFLKTELHATLFLENDKVFFKIINILLT